MALFKISRGNSATLPSVMTDGWAYFCTDTGEFFIDYADDSGLHRKQINANEAKKLIGYDIETVLNDSAVEIPTSSAVFSAINDLSEGFSSVIYQMYGDDITDNGAPTIRQIANDEANSALGSAKAYTDSAVDPLSDAIDGLTTNYNESIIGLSVDGTTVTYIKGDGTSHSFETQDTNTTYSLGTDEVTGLTKLYATTGSAEDGTMTQKAIKTELDKKVGVTVDSTQNALVFTI